jgi:hypothetical protein
MNVLNRTIDRLIIAGGDWNAQLFRELKSRLNSKNLVIITICSMLAQGCFLKSALLNLPISNVVDGHPSYCEFNLPPLPFNSDNVCRFTRSSARYTSGQIDAINWSRWWSEVFTGLSGLIAVFLVVAGVYLLAKDWRIEEKRGTLNFVQLSPQSAWDIFIGKILGVPILIYLAAGLALPLQFIAGFCSNFGLFHTIIWDLWWLVIISSFYLGAILLAKVMPFVLALLAWGLQYIIATTMMFFVNGAIDSSFNIVLWNGIVSRDVSWAIAIGIGICSLVAYSLWGLLAYSYNNPISEFED